MNDFNELRKNWMEQPIQKPSEEGFAQLKKRIGSVGKKQRIGNIVLLSTIGVLVLFFFYVGAIKHKEVAMALGAMIAALAFRVLVEFFSLKNLNNLSTTQEIQRFKKRLASYHKIRIWVHLVLTPILLAIYCFAFWTLLPAFKASLSEGFYEYIVVSSVILLLVFSVFIGFQVRKELHTLKELRD